MIYFALNPDGLIYNLGDHGDILAAEDTAENMDLDAIFIFDENQAQSVANFINDQLRITESTK